LHGNCRLQSQISQSANVDLCPFRLKYLELQKFNWYKLNCFGFLTQRPISAPNCSKKKMSYEGDMIFQRWQLNYASKQVSWRNESKLHSEASKPISKFLFQQFSSSKSKLEDFMQDYFSFFRKIVIEVLNCKLST
jgi:hypothetical protein